jgi:tetratricopeptide (TPR) repeat protein
MSTGDESRRWDFFVSYTQADRAWAEWIAWQLEQDGHRVLVQAWDFVGGTNWIARMQDGTRGAARTIALLSPEYLESVYGSAEWQVAWASDPDGTGSKLLTVRVCECERPGLLAGVVCTDLFGIDEAKARTRLSVFIAGALSDRAKPGTEPEFPGRAIIQEPRFPGALPRVWKMPARNPNFTGRTEELADLGRRMVAGSPVTVQAVRGMGGVGKTQLAVEYAYARAADYDLVWWIAAEEPAAIPDQFAALAARLGLAVGADPEALREVVHEELRHVAGWLLVFDNADAVEDVAPWLPSGPLPAGIPGHVLITTRRGGFGGLGQVMDLDVIDLPPAVQLMRTRVPGLGQVIGEQIAEQLGRLPLALEQAAAYLDQTQMPPEDYRELLRSRAADLYARGVVASRSDTIATLWDISLERISRQSPAGVQLLSVCAYLAPEPIPLDLFTEHPDRLPEPLASATADPLAFTDTVAVLADYSLVRRTAAGLQLHRLVQDAVRIRHTPAPPATPPSSLPRPDQAAIQDRHPAQTALSLLRVSTPGRVMGAPEAWPRWTQLLPHALAAISHLDDAAGQDDRRVMADAAWLLDRGAAYLRVYARLAEARPLQERALAISEAAYGPDHPTVATRLNNLALILRDLGQPGEARPLQERALAITETAYGPIHPAVATALNNLAQILQDLGQPGEARPLQERALATTETAYGPDHPTVATRLNNLAQILRDLGQPGEARPLQERALAITQTAYGPEHPEVAIRLNNLGLILQDLGLMEAARPLQERALAIDEAAYGPDHPTVAGRLNNLALILRDLGQPDEARPLQERALAITETAYGPDHPAVATALNNLALIMRELGRPGRARPLLERALAIDQAAYGPDHPEIAADLNNLALILHDLGQFEEARPLEEHALTIAREMRLGRPMRTDGHE